MRRVELPSPACGRGRGSRRWLSAVLSTVVLAMAQSGRAEESAQKKTIVAADDATCPAGMGEQTARLVQARYEGIRDIHADFEQTSVAATFAGEPLMTPDPKTGQVVFAKPGKMRWSYVTPEASVVVSNGQILWIYDVAAKSVTRLEVTSGFLSGAALQFLLGDGQILESFEVKAPSCTGDLVTLDLTPKSDATYDRLGLVANRISGDIVATSVLDLFGNLTRISFSKIEINRDPKSEIFELEVPDGVEVIDYKASKGWPGP